MSDIDVLKESNDTSVRVKYNENTLNIQVNSKKEGIIMLPLVYLDGYKSGNNDIVKVFDNFIGIKVHQGKNVINISFFLSTIFTVESPLPIASGAQIHKSL